MTDYKKIDLAQFAAQHYGFVLADRSTQHTPRLKNQAGDIILLKLQEGGNNTFFSPTAGKKGTIFEFVMWQERITDSKVAATKIRELLGEPQHQTNTHIPTMPKEPSKGFDAAAAKRLQPILEPHAYLESRGIPFACLEHARFRGTVLTDDYHNAVFPHYQNGEIVGYTKKNQKFNGFSEGGTKLLWKSNQLPTDKTLVICEAGIDALSYATLTHIRAPQDLDSMRFISIDGGTSPEAIEQLKKEIAQMPGNAQIIGAFDNDTQGKKYSGMVEELCKQTNHGYAENLPKIKNYDWNNVLVAANKRVEQKKRVNLHAIEALQAATNALDAGMTAMVNHIG